MCTRSHALSELSVNGSHKGWLLSLRLLMEQRKQLRGSSTVEVISSQGDVDREEVLEPFDIENESRKESSSFDVGYSSGDSLETLPKASTEAISPADILKTLFFILVWYTFSTFLTL